MRATSKLSADYLPPTLSTYLLFPLPSCRASPTFLQPFATRPALLKNPPIYVETLIRCPMDALWDHTQQPDLHQQWDLRFTEIRYLPRSVDSEPQQFLYATRIGFGLGVAGRGKVLAPKRKMASVLRCLNFGRMSGFR
ncbi:hypothetical protein [Hymenobacter sp. HDW8]|uniref:hypothetical protein n=1 Tax=Hymenobacter sp. HDW8 TaxID=2714932 RepID=UPI00196A5DB4|nr:hypothetical protein [Hymenobacter sp. HDW8]